MFIGMHAPVEQGVVNNSRQYINMCGGRGIFFSVIIRYQVL